MFIIPQDKAEKFIEQLPIDKFYGIGSVTAEKMHRFGMHCGAEIAELYKIEKDLMRRLIDSDTYGRTVTLKIKFDDSKQITRSRTIQKYIHDFNTLHREVSEILRLLDLKGTRILLRVSISNLESEKTDILQLDLF
jgi:DNA polymerase-4